MSSRRVLLLALAALLLTPLPAGPAAADDCPWSPGNPENWCHNGGGGDDDGSDPTPAPTAEPTPEPTPEPQPDPTPAPTQPPAPDPTPAPQRDTSPSRTTTRSTPRPTASVTETPEPTPLETPDPAATPEILVQGPVLDDDSGDDSEQLDVAQGAAENERSGGWAFFLVGFILGGAIGWVGRGIRSMRRRRRQQLFG